MGSTSSCCSKPKPHGHPSNEKPSTSMGSQTQSFSLQLSGGERVEVKGSALEARATLARLGGRGEIKPL